MRRFELQSNIKSQAPWPLKISRVRLYSKPAQIRTEVFQFDTLDTEDCCPYLFVAGMYLNSLNQLIEWGSYEMASLFELEDECGNCE